MSMLDDAIADDLIASLTDVDPVAAHLRVLRGGSDLVLTIAHRGAPITLSQAVPLLEQLGVSVVDQQRHDREPTAQAVPVWADTYGLAIADPAPLRQAAVAAEFERAFRSMLRGQVEADGFNRLVLAGLSVEQATVLRALAAYLRQVSPAHSLAATAGALSANGAIARALIGYFEARLDPDQLLATTADLQARQDAIIALLADVSSLADDRVLRSVLRVMTAIVRTNYFQPPDGARAATLAFKFDPSLVPDLPAPRPTHEIWVYSPRVEGVHLRSGDVARGGIRWSDRRADFRTEVLGLMKAQVVKNAVIVPTGAKGGFVVKQPPSDPDAMRGEVEACYRLFIGSLLDVTDNVVNERVVAPIRTVCRDGNDPYLVVAADKGTATFSDIANSIAVGRGFWLGDAFASGGSAGYDHKVMAITARGAWESVRSHARVIGRNADTEQLSVVGIGDMSGDVFGNGLLRSDQLRLIAAFDHRHVFVDPDPDPSRSFTERVRLFALTRSSWADYDTALLSAGGGIWPRTQKSIALSAAGAAALGLPLAVGSEGISLAPAELISAILRAPVDLLWNGGIGTYVKATDEREGDIGDHANDAVRVNGSELRCAMVAEGGNLGLSQRGRIEYALCGGPEQRGGLINTDAIDNSAGVDCSDHEVNIKIVLAGAVTSGQLSITERDEFLATMTDEVAAQVLADNVAQNRALSNARTQAPMLLDVHRRYIAHLAADHHLDRDLEALPTDRQISERHGAGRGLTTPELAVLLAHTKIAGIGAVLDSSVPDDPFLRRELFEYFPVAMRERFAPQIAGHRLGREIVATAIVNRMVNTTGISSGFRVAEQTGASMAHVCAAHVVAAELLDANRWWREVESLEAAVAEQVQTALLLTLRTMIERATMWLLTHRSRTRPIGESVAELHDSVAAALEHLAETVAGEDRSDVEAQTSALTTAGIAPSLATRAALWPLAHVAFDVADVAGRCGYDVALAMEVHELIGDRLGLDWLRRRIEDLPRNDRWQTQGRFALRQRLDDEHRELCASVIGSADDPGEGVDKWRRWELANSAALERATTTISEVRALATTDLTSLLVCVAALGDLRKAPGR
jgi:glutamate dehydrogenase